MSTNDAISLLGVEALGGVESDVCRRLLQFGQDFATLKRHQGIIKMRYRVLSAAISALEEPQSEHKRDVLDSHVACTEHRRELEASELFRAILGGTDMSIDDIGKLWPKMKK